MSEYPVLVAYATTSGSTREIAEFVAAELAGQGVQAEARPCREVKTLDGYGAVVLGAALYMFRLHGDAASFLRRHQKRLEQLPVAVFAGGPYGPTADADSVSVQKNLEGQLAKYPWLKPASVQQVGGRFDPALLRFPWSLIPAMKQAPPADARDWDEIRAWAQALPTLLGISTPTVE